MVKSRIIKKKLLRQINNNIYTRNGKINFLGKTHKKKKHLKKTKKNKKTNIFINRQLTKKKGGAFGDLSISKSRPPQGKVEVANESHSTLVVAPKHVPVITKLTITLSDGYSGEFVSEPQYASTEKGIAFATSLNVELKKGAIVFKSDGNLDKSPIIELTDVELIAASSIGPKNPGDAFAHISTSSSVHSCPLVARVFIPSLTRTVENGFKLNDEKDVATDVAFMAFISKTLNIDEDSMFQLYMPSPVKSINFGDKELPGFPMPLGIVQSFSSACVIDNRTVMAWIIGSLLDNESSLQPEELKTRRPGYASTLESYKYMKYCLDTHTAHKKSFTLSQSKVWYVNSQRLKKFFVFERKYVSGPHKLFREKKSKYITNDTVCSVTIVTSSDEQVSVEFGVINTDLYDKNTLRGLIKKFALKVGAHLNITSYEQLAENLSQINESACLMSDNDLRNACMFSCLCSSITDDSVQSDNCEVAAMTHDNDHRAVFKNKSTNHELNKVPIIRACVVPCINVKDKKKLLYALGYADMTGHMVAGPCKVSMDSADMSIFALPEYLQISNKESKSFFIMKDLYRDDNMLASGHQIDPGLPKTISRKYNYLIPVGVEYSNLKYEWSGVDGRTFKVEIILPDGKPNKLVFDSSIENLWKTIGIPILVNGKVDFFIMSNPTNKKEFFDGLVSKTFVITEPLDSFLKSIRADTATDIIAHLNGSFKWAEYLDNLSQMSGSSPIGSSVGPLVLSSLNKPAPTFFSSPAAAPAPAPAPAAAALSFAGIGSLLSNAALIDIHFPLNERQFSEVVAERESGALKKTGNCTVEGFLSIVFYLKRAGMISALDKEGNTFSGNDDILKELRKFHKYLYSLDANSAYRILKSIAGKEQLINLDKILYYCNVHKHIISAATAAAPPSFAAATADPAAAPPPSTAATAAAPTFSNKAFFGPKNAETADPAAAPPPFTAAAAPPPFTAAADPAAAPPPFTATADPAAAPPPFTAPAAPAAPAAAPPRKAFFGSENKAAPAAPPRKAFFGSENNAAAAPHSFTAAAPHPFSIPKFGPNVNFSKLGVYEDLRSSNTKKNGNFKKKKLSRFNVNLENTSPVGIEISRFVDLVEDHIKFRAFYSDYPNILALHEEFTSMPKKDLLELLTTTIDKSKRNSQGFGRISVRELGSYYANTYLPGSNNEDGPKRQRDPVP